MKNAAFYQLLHAPRRPRTPTQKEAPVWTVAKVAAAIQSGRAHVTEVLNNTPHHGGQTRAKLVAFFEREFPQSSGAMLQALGWRADAGRDHLIRNSGTQEKNQL